MNATQQKVDTYIEGTKTYRRLKAIKDAYRCNAISKNEFCVLVGSIQPNKPKWTTPNFHTHKHI